MVDLNQFLDKDISADDIKHSNGFGVVAGGGGAGGLSMEQRRKLLNQPRVVGSYRHSRLGRQSASSKSRTADQQRARVYDASTDIFANSAKTSNRRLGNIKDQNQANAKSVERRQIFVEPPSRNYDKYV